METPDFDSKKHPACILVENGWVEVDGGRVYRYFTTPDSKEFVLSDAYAKQIGVLWPKFSISNRVPEFQSSHVPILGIEVEKVEHVSYYPEWAPKQVLDGLILLCDVEIACLEHGFFTQSHLWNVLLHKGKPIFIDLGDFIRYENSNRGDYTILGTVLGHFRKTRTPHNPMNICENFAEKVNAQQLVDSVNQLNAPLIEKFKYLKSFLENLSPSTEAGYWSNYNKATLHSNESIAKSSGLKSKNLCDFIEKNRPTTLTDLGCNNGIYSIFSSRLGIPAVGIDLDSSSIELANEYCANQNLHAIFSTFDILQENIAYGVDGVFGSSVQRLNSEMVIAPALIHHIFRQNNSIKDTLEIICSYGQNYVAIEYIGHNDKHINVSADTWFAMEDIVHFLLNHDFTVSVEESNLPTRNWIFGVKKERAVL